MTSIQEYLLLTYGIDSNTSATILITLFVFFIGIIVQHFLTLYSSYIQRKRIRKIFKISFESLIRQISQQSEEFKKTADGLRFDKGKNFAFKKTTISSISSLNEIGYQKIYEALFFGFENSIKCNIELKLKAFNKIWASIKSIEYWHDRPYQEINKFLEKYNEFNKRRNTAIENHRRYFDEIATETNGKIIPKNIGLYVTEVDKIKVNWENKSDRTRPDVIHRNLIIPLRILNRKNIDLRIANDMNNDLLEATSEYENQRNLLNAQKKQFETYSRTFRSLAKIGTKAMKIL